MQAFVPSTGDVFSVRAILAWFELPNELILSILDYARYWVEMKSDMTIYEVLMDEEHSLDYSAALLYMQVRAFPRTRDYSQRKVREIEFIVVSHDQGWTTERTRGTYETSSWFEVSIARTRSGNRPLGLPHHPVVYSNIYQAKDAISPDDMSYLVRRPSSALEPQRMHCNEMMKITHPVKEDPTNTRFVNTPEGEHSWYLQGNEVARDKNLFEGEMIKRYRIVWGSAANPTWAGNEGSGKGEGFVDSLQKSDMIFVWARAKRRAWENHVHGIRMTIRYNI